MSKVLQKYANTRPRDEDEDNDEYVEIEEVKRGTNKKIKNVTSLVAAAKKTTDLKPSNEAAALTAATSALTKGGKKNVSAGGKAESAVMYLGHIPHGFYEPEMRKFFAQFGAVKRIRLFRSRKTGNSKGYAFVEFGSADVAKTVTEAMDGYFLMERKLVAEVVPVERHHKMMFAKFRDNDVSDSEEEESEGETKEEEPLSPEQLAKQAKLMSNKRKRLEELGFEFESPSILSSSSAPATTSATKKEEEAPRSSKKAKTATVPDNKTPAKVPEAVPASQKKQVSNKKKQAEPEPEDSDDEEEEEESVVAPKSATKKTPAKKEKEEAPSSVKKSEPAAAPKSASKKTPAKTPAKEEPVPVVKTAEKVEKEVTKVSAKKKTPKSNKKVVKGKVGFTADF